MKARRSRGREKSREGTPFSPFQRRSDCEIRTVAPFPPTGRGEGPRPRAARSWAQGARVHPGDRARRPPAGAFPSRPRSPRSAPLPSRRLSRRFLVARPGPGGGGPEGLGAWGPGGLEGPGHTQCEAPPTMKTTGEMPGPSVTDSTASEILALTTCFSKK